MKIRLINLIKYKATLGCRILRQAAKKQKMTGKTAIVVNVTFTKKRFRCTTYTSFKMLKQATHYSVFIVIISNLLNRFNVTANDGYKFSYNPCYSFSLGSFGDCSGDIAVSCRQILFSAYYIDPRKVRKRCDLIYQVNNLGG